MRNVGVQRAGPQVGGCIVLASRLRKTSHVKRFNLADMGRNMLRPYAGKYSGPFSGSFPQAVKRFRGQAARNFLRRDHSPRKMIFDQGRRMSTLQDAPQLLTRTK